MESGEHAHLALAWFIAVRQGGPLGPVVFSLSLKPGLKIFHSEFDGERVDAFAYTGNTALVLMKLMESMVRAIPPLRARARRNRHRCQTHRRRGAASERESSDGGRILAAGQLPTSGITVKGSVPVVGVPLGNRRIRGRARGGGGSKGGTCELRGASPVRHARQASGPLPWFPSNPSYRGPAT